jgi:guanylate kinase
MNINDILKDSSLRGIVSDAEIAELAEELSFELEEYIEAEKEKAKDDAEEDMENLHREIRKLEEKASALEGKILPIETLKDEMTLDWIKENWDQLHVLSDMNISGKEIVSKMHESTAIGCSSIDAVALMQSVLSNEIKKVTTHKRVVLVGRAASGKDHMRKTLENKGFKYAVSYTTRPKRDAEVHGVDYYFLSSEEFEAMIERKAFYEHVSFNGWHYGTTNEQFYSDDVFIMTPHGISHIDPNDRKNTFIMYLDMKLGVRQRRLTQRSDADTVERRLAADDRDFADFKDFDIKITNHDF